jgi:hypothetical protein
MSSVTDIERWRADPRPPSTVARVRACARYGVLVVGEEMKGLVNCNFLPGSVLLESPVQLADSQVPHLSTKGVHSSLSAMGGSPKTSPRAQKPSSSCRRLAQIPGSSRQDRRQ